MTVVARCDYAANAGDQSFCEYNPGPSSMAEVDSGTYHGWLIDSILGQSPSMGLSRVSSFSGAK